MGFDTEALLNVENESVPIGQHFENAHYQQKPPHQFVLALYCDCTKNQ